MNNRLITTYISTTYNLSLFVIIYTVIHIQHIYYFLPTAPLNGRLFKNKCPDSILAIFHAGISRSRSLCVFFFAEGHGEADREGPAVSTTERFTLQICCPDSSWSQVCSDFVFEISHKFNSWNDYTVEMQRLRFRPMLR